jgi:hypothetical protein
MSSSAAASSTVVHHAYAYMDRHFGPTGETATHLLRTRKRLICR